MPTLEQINQTTSLADLYAGAEAEMEDQNRMYMLDAFAHRIDTLEAITLSQIKATKKLDKLYDLLDGERDGLDRCHIIDAIKLRIVKVENLLLDMQTGAVPISTGYAV